MTTTAFADKNRRRRSYCNATRQAYADGRNARRAWARGGAFATLKEALFKECVKGTMGCERKVVKRETEAG